jgi:hypothetical protein
MLKPVLAQISPTRTPVRPRLSVTNPAFEYTPAARTNVQATWRRFGWKAPLKAPK